MDNRITENRLSDEKIEKYRFSNRYDAPSVEDVQDMAQEVYERRQAEKEQKPVAWLHKNSPIGLPAITVSEKVANSWIKNEFEVVALGVINE